MADLLYIKITRHILEINLDMVELFNSLGKDRAIWIGHDWGSQKLGMALHHPDKVRAVGSLCVPFGFGGHPEGLLNTVNETFIQRTNFLRANGTINFITMKTLMLPKKKWMKTHTS